ncbi:MAG: Na+/H+ antiporter subunit E [Candidatus Sumerlaeaceae bacterium]|nr:Na+/H+ antiporter subunit E [Candidatus Sumerlaeaceae bacterium]
MRRLLYEGVVAGLICFVAGWLSIAALALVFAAVRLTVQCIVWWRRDRRVWSRLWNLVRFLADFAADLVKSNLILAYDILVPWDIHTIRLVEVSLEGLSDCEVAVLSHRITLTPGTLSCAVGEGRRALLVHAMYGKSPTIADDLRRPVDILKGRA